MGQQLLDQLNQIARLQDYHSSQIRVKLMSDFGFTFKALYQLEGDALWELARIIKGEDHFLPHNKDVLIRGVIIPYLKDASKAPRGISKDEIMRNGLVKVGKDLGVRCENWDTASEAWLSRQIRNAWTEAFRKKFEDLSKEEREAILKQAEENLNTAARGMGASFIPAAGVVAGEMSGFGIYLGTTTGLGAISSAMGITFPWAVYQGATTALGVILGPIGWAITGGLMVVTGGGLLYQLFKQQSQKLQVVVISLIVAIGNNPYDWFGLPETATMSEVKKVYRTMVKMFHPDTIPAETPEWLKHQLNQMLLQTFEQYDRIKKHQSEAD